MKLLIDGVFFQIANTGIARVWASIIPYIVNATKIEVFVLDRGGLPDIEGVSVIPFPNMQFYNTAYDSLLIQKICDEYDIDIFSSTYYTTPISTPSVLMVYDMIPELFDFDLSQRAWREKELGILHANRLVAISENTKRDLLTFYPEIPDINIDVAYCGVDSNVFKNHTEVDIKKFRKEYKLKRDYFLFVGSRTQHKGYKNCTLFFDALSKCKASGFDILCAGGDKEIEPEIMASLPDKMTIQRIAFSDEDLSKAYNGALALVYPSLYEGFGMPVIEALSSGTNVITTQHGSLKEAAGNECHLISGLDVDEMAAAIDDIFVNKPKLNKTSVEKHLSQFNWKTMAEKYVVALESALSKPRNELFYRQWGDFRAKQAAFDI